MKLQIICACVVVNFAFLSSSFADDISYTLPITRNGATETMVAYKMWSTEYPGPVINVKAGVKGTTMIKAEKSLRTLGTPVNCTIANGLYHPWSTNPSPLEFYTITPLTTYKAKRDVELEVNGDDGQIETLKLKAGESLTREIYLSEGYCRVSAPTVSGDKEFDLSCDSYGDAQDFTKTVGAGEGEQWLYLKCGEGYAAFVQDKVLLAHPGVKEGQITGYGSVAP